MGIQIKTRTTYDLSSEFSTSSPGSKTPTLVARLMGLDILPPHICSTSSSSSTSNPPSKFYPQMTQSRSSSVGDRNLFHTDIICTRSLPETPRISSARRSDVEYHHRLSLQNNKENSCVAEDLSRNLTMKIAAGKRRDQVMSVEEDESRRRSTAGKYARQIVNQVKEKVSRKVGADITNTIRNREMRGINGDDIDHVVLLKAKKPSKGWERGGDESSPSNKSTTPSSSPRLSIQNQVISNSTKSSQWPLSSSVNVQPQSGRVSSNQKSRQVLIKQNPDKRKSKKITSEGYSPQVKKHSTNSSVYRNKQEEIFVRSASVTSRVNTLDKKSKKTPLSIELLNTNVPTLFPIMKEYPSSSAAKFPQKQSHASDALSSKRSRQLSICLSQQLLTSYKQEATYTPTVQELRSRYNSSKGNTNGGGTAFQYITTILRSTGINKNTPLSFIRWYSPSHPLNPSLFHHLEISFPIPTTKAATIPLVDSQLIHQWNRKLIFQLLDEILVEILKPYMNIIKPWVSGLTFTRSMNGSDLMEKICAKIRSFPSADCRVLEDIDGIIERDLGGRSEIKGISMAALEEEGEAIVAEVERELVETLVHEMAVGVVFL